MKKLLCALLICAICAGALAGCGRRQASGDDASGGDAPAYNPENTPVPEEGAHGEQDQSQALAEMPTLAPAETLSSEEAASLIDDDDDDDSVNSDDYYSIDALINSAETDGAAEDELPQASQAPVQPVGSNVIDPNTLQYSALNDPDMKLTFNYPSDWVNVPGVFTVCYREMVEPGDFPARVAISAKLLVHSPEGMVLTDELTSFVRVIRKQYDSETFQLGTLNSEDTFLERQAYSNTYLAYSGETEVKGFVIGCAIGRVLYVFHFCASYEDYTAMERVMRYMLNSVHILQDEKKE